MSTTEQLFACPVCSTPNFSAKGLRTHCCRAKPNRARLTDAELVRAGAVQPLSMSKGKPSKPANAVVVLNDAALTVQKQQLVALQSSTVKTLSLIQHEEQANTLRRVLVGFALHRIKASLKHGEWMPWLKKGVKGKGYAQCNFYMRLATVAAEEMRVTRPELLALPGDQSELSLDTAEGEARRFMEKLTKFVGDKTFNELLDEHGIKETKKIGGAREKRVVEADPTDTDPEQLYLAARDEIGGALAHAESLLVTENRLQFLAGHPEEISGVVSGLRSLADKVEAAAKPLLKK